MADISSDPLSWSTTASSNSPSGGTTIGSGLDDNLRAIQAALKSVIVGMTGVAGTNTITATAGNVAAYVTGAFFLFTPANTNTGATTLNVGGIGAKNVFCGGAACVGGEIFAGVPCMVCYDGTQFNIVGPFSSGLIPAGQIKFPATQNASTNANTLDDYEEGNWTPTDASGAALSLTVVADGCLYVKIGRMIMIEMDVTFPATADATDALFGGLPYASTASTNRVGGGAMQGVNIASAMMTVVANSTTCFITSATTRQKNSDLSGRVIRGAFMYMTAA